MQHLHLQRLVPRYGLRKSEPLATESDAQDEQTGQVVGAATTPLASGSQRPLAHYLIGPALEEALAKDPEDVEVYWPFRSPPEGTALTGTLEDIKVRRKDDAGERVDWRGREAILWVHPFQKDKTLGYRVDHSWMVAFRQTLHLLSGMGTPASKQYNSVSSHAITSTTHPSTLIARDILSPQLRVSELSSIPYPSLCHRGRIRRGSLDRAQCAYRLRRNRYHRSK